MHSQADWGEVCGNYCNVETNERGLRLLECVLKWVTKDVLDLCDERRDWKKKRYEAEGAKENREANKRIQRQ